MSECAFLNAIMAEPDPRRRAYLRIFRDALRRRFIGPGVAPDLIGRLKLEPPLESDFVFPAERPIWPPIRLR